MQTRTLLAALAVAILALTAPAEAKRAVHQETLRNPGVQIDVAAIPAYPMADRVKAGRQPRAAASRSAERRATGRQAREGRKASPAPRQAESGLGIVRSHKTGATAHVRPASAPKFQAYVDDLEANGAEVLFMGGYRKGRCWTGGRHPCGMALDVCQLRRGVVDRRCHLPAPSAIFAIAARHGLFEGAGWGNSDYGHAQDGGNDAVAVRFGSGQMSARAHRFHKIRFAARR